jgi:hypothetical protein
LHDNGDKTTFNVKKIVKIMMINGVP